MANIVQKDNKAYRVWDKTNNEWNELNLKTNTNSVFDNSGTKLATKIDAINGITSDLSGEADDIAASIACVNKLNNSLEQQPQFVYDENGKITGYTTKIGGADSVFPFKQGFNEVWVRYNYANVSCMDRDENVLHSRVSIYNKNISGNYLNLSYSSSKSEYMITALQDCTVVMTLAGNNYNGIPGKVVSMKKGDTNIEWKADTGSLLVI